MEARTPSVVPFSVLDLSPVVKGSTPAQAFRNTLDLARHVERLGFNRYWMAEHHNMPGIASSATAVLIGHVAAGTSRIRVGSGGIMLPNHPPLIVAEQFGTLESLYPGRIDLGLGRAPGTDAITTRALRRDPFAGAEQFPDDLQELLGYFAPTLAGQRVRAVPGAGLEVPVWLLGSSMYSAELAARMGLPFAFASHFAPDYLLAALDAYRRYFQPSARLEQPHAMAAINVVAAATDEEARRLFSSVQQQFINLRHGVPGRLQDPAEIDTSLWTTEDHQAVAHVLHYAVVGGPEAVRAGLERFLQLTGVNEVMVTAHVFDHEARKRSFEIVADVRALTAAA
ncbi:MAG TPA: LLM class flavin-dependent oxidoreductase [Vicinamibacterales bacterium]|nr:LLM class flavin-dependent oxidoreductase [Vicinamibacterales bacterium]